MLQALGFLAVHIEYGRVAPRQHPDGDSEISEQVLERDTVDNWQARHVGIDGGLHVRVQPSAGPQRDSQRMPIDVLKPSSARHTPDLWVSTLVLWRVPEHERCHD